MSWEISHRSISRSVNSILKLEWWNQSSKVSNKFTKVVVGLSGFGDEETDCDHVLERASDKSINSVTNFVFLFYSKDLFTNLTSSRSRMSRSNPSTAPLNMTGGISSRGSPKLKFTFPNHSINCFKLLLLVVFNNWMIQQGINNHII